MVMNLLLYCTWQLLFYLEALPDIRQILLNLVADIQPGTFFCTFQPLLATVTGKWQQVLNLSTDIFEAAATVPFTW
jgi:hypothetical protein